MPGSMNFLLATEDVAERVLNATVAVQTKHIDSVEVYEAVVENVGLLNTREFMAGKFMFPVPRSTIKGYVLKLSVADEDDSELLNQSLEYIFGLKAHPDIRLQNLKLMAKKKGYDVETSKPAELYARVRLPSQDTGHNQDVDAFFGYRFKPTREAVSRLKNAYPGLVSARHAMLPMGKAKEDKPAERTQGTEVFDEKIKNARKRRSILKESVVKEQAPSPDEILLFNDLLRVYLISETGPALAELDAELISGFAEGEDVLPFVKTMVYSRTMSRDEDGQFKTTENVLADIINRIGSIGKDLLDE